MSGQAGDGVGAVQGADSGGCAESGGAVISFAVADGRIVNAAGVKVPLAVWVVTV